jgi:hypothetical protein
MLMGGSYFHGAADCPVGCAVVAHCTQATLQVQLVTCRLRPWEEVVIQRLISLQKWTHYFVEVFRYRYDLLFGLYIQMFL